MVIRSVGVPELEALQAKRRDLVGEDADEEDEHPVDQQRRAEYRNAEAEPDALVEAVSASDEEERRGDREEDAHRREQRREADDEQERPQAVSNDAYRAAPSSGLHLDRNELDLTSDRKVGEKGCRRARESLREQRQEPQEGPPVERPKSAVDVGDVLS